MKRHTIVVVGVLVLVMAAVVGVMVGLSGTVSELAVEMNRNQVDAILASADVKDESVVSVPVLYYNQAADECVNLYDKNSNSLAEARQFEWSKCGYYNRNIETGLVAKNLNENYLPVGVGGVLVSNRGVGGDNFGRWFNTVEGKSSLVAFTINLRYDAGTASFSYENDEFYPLGGGKEHLFTMNLGIPIEVIGEGKETLAVSADDDTWIFVGGELVIDMGGIHKVTNGRFKIQENGEVWVAVGDEDLAYSGVDVEKGSREIVRIFHANRDSVESAFRINFSNMLLNVTDATLAKVDDAATVAYNPEEEGHAAPLGESLTYTPNKSRMILTSAIVQASALGALAVVLMVVISAVWRYARRDHNQE